MKEIIEKHWTAIFVVICAFVLIGYSEYAKAEGPEVSAADIAANKCTVSWVPGDGGGPVDGYRITVNSETPVDVNDTQLDCSLLPMPVGQNSLTVTAYNAGGEASSNPFPFVVLPAAPAAPTNLQMVVQ